MKQKEIKHKLIFNGATFKKRADFKNLVFKENIDFSNARFEDDVYFNRSKFEQEADFHESGYKRIACFYRVEFKKIPNFSSAIFFSDSKLNLINSTLSKAPYSFKDLKEKIEEKISKPRDNKKLDKKEKENLKREWLAEREKIANDYRDSFRTLKNALLKDDNLLDAQDHHRLELYCKEIELSNSMDKTQDAKKHPESEMKGVNFNVQKFKEWIDSLHLSFYRNLCDHHTNLLKIINNLMILVTLFALFAWGLKELSLIGDHPNRMGEMLYDIVVAQVFEFFKIENFLRESKIEPQSVLPIIVIVGIIALLLLVEFCKSQFLQKDLVNFFKDLWLLLKFCCFYIVFLPVLGIIGIFIFALPMKRVCYIFSFSLLFIILFLWLISLRTLIARYFIVLLAYFGFLYTLCNQPFFINPFIGGLFNSKQDFPLIFQNPIFITLTIVYSILMFLLLFSLQKTARKNSIIPT